MLEAYQDFLVAHQYRLYKITTPWELRLNLLVSTRETVKLMGDVSSYSAPSVTFADIRGELSNILSYVLLILAERNDKLDFDELLERMNPYSNGKHYTDALTQAVWRFLGCGYSPENAYDVVYYVYRIAIHYKSSLLELVIYKWESLLKDWDAEL